MRLALCALCLLVALPALAAQTVAVDGVPHIRNGAKPAAGTQTVELSPVWTRGGDDDEILFGVVRHVLRDAAGNTYLLDSQLAEIQVIDPKGEWLRTAGRKGEGPGELNPNVSDFFFTPAGKLGVSQRFPGRVVQLELSGEAASDFPLPTDQGFLTVNVGRTSGKNLVLGGTVTSGGHEGMTRNAYLRIYDASGAEIASLFRAPYPMDFNTLLFKEVELVDSSAIYNVDKGGRILMAGGWNDYAISVFGPDGKLQHVIEREYDLGKRNKEQLERAKQRYRINVNGRDAKLEIAESERAIYEIIPRPDGGFWVRNGRATENLSNGCIVAYDAYDAKGEFQNVVQLKAEGDLEEDGVIVRDDHVYVVRGLNAASRANAGGGEDDETEGDVEPLTIVCYQMPQGSTR